MICCCWDLAILVTELAMSFCVEVGEETRYQSLLVSSSEYRKPPTTGVLARAKALEAVVPPLATITTGIPLPVVCAPTPPTLWIVRKVEPVAFPPLITSSSEAEPVPPSTVFMVRFAPVPT